MDPHRISTTGGSAGGGEIHYLTWVYHALSRDGVPNANRYTPRAMVYTMAQLDYPVQNMLDKVWSHWVDDIGGSTKLSTILAYSDCGMIIGNPWCSEQAETPLCNQTFQDASMALYCNTEAAFNQATLADVMATQNWPVITEQDKGIATLWYNSVNMLNHAPKPFYLYIANALNSTAGMNVVHNALYCTTSHIITSLPFFQNSAKKSEWGCIFHPAPLDTGCKTRLESSIKRFNHISFMIPDLLDIRYSRTFGKYAEQASEPRIMPNSTPHIMPNSKAPFHHTSCPTCPTAKPPFSKWRQVFFSI